MQLIAYYRVSNPRQAKGSPGLEAQRSAVERLRQRLERDRGAAVVVGGFVEIEGRPGEPRPQLARALAAARKRGAAVVVAKLRRLATDAGFLEQLAAETDRGGFGGFLFADLPAYARGDSAGWAGVVYLAAQLARFDLDANANHTREALAAAKAGGSKLGGLRPGTLRENARTKEAAAERSEALRPILAPLQAEGASFGAMARALYAAGTRTGKGEPLSRSAVKRHLERLGLIA